MTPAVSVIVPNWNGASRLQKLFECLRQQACIRETILVDNGSTDGSIAYARQAGARVIALPGNAGFTVAVNHGIRAAVCEWLFVLNNDVELESHYIGALLAAAVAREAWFATGKLLDAKNRNLIDGTFDALCRGGTAWRCGAGQPDGAMFGTETAIQFAPFTAVLLRKSLIASVGLLDERFESYLEDVEFGLRCANGGFAGVYVPGAVAYHHGSATLGRWHAATVRRLARNQLFLVAKHYPRGGRSLWAVIVAQTLWGLVALRHGAGLAWAQGKLEGLRGFRSVSKAAPAWDPSPVLARSERQIRDIQSKTGFDLYWRLYFLLT